jgi:glucosyl-3-phosphoglycerate synthase
LRGSGRSGARCSPVSRSRPDNAVEFAALVDTCRILGLDAIAQVDLGRRAHRHPALRDLGAMATQILAIALRSSGPDGPETVALRQYQPAANAIRATVREVNTGTRPQAAPLLEEPVS